MKITTLRLAQSLLGLVLILSYAKQIVSKPTSSANPTTVYSPYWYVDDKTIANLEIANTGATSKSVSLTLAIRGRRLTPLAPINVVPFGTVRLSLGEILKKQGFLDEGTQKGNGQGERQDADNKLDQWGTGQRMNSTWGSAELSIDDPNNLMAWILMTDPTESISINSPFQAPSGFWSSRLQTIWWLPTPGSDAFYALENVSKQAAKIEVAFTSEGPLGASQWITLAPSETRLVRVRQMLSEDGNKSKGVPGLGAIEFRHNGKPGDVIGPGILVDPAVGFSTPLMLSDPAHRGGNTIQNPSAAFGTMPEKGFPPTADFHPQLILSNTSDAAVSAKVTIYGKKSGSAITWEAGNWQVPPKSVIKTDIETLRLKSHAIDGGIAGIDLTHTGSPSALLAEVITVDSTLTFSFYDPFFDPLATIENALTAISFNLEGSNNTMFIAKNTMKSPSRFALKINYKSGGRFDTYIVPMQVVLPKQVAVIDFKELRDSAVPDKNGKRLPRDVVFGNAQLITDIPNSFVGSDPTFNPITGTCTSCVGGETREQLLQDLLDLGFDFTGIGLCRGTTDCSYYDDACRRAPTVSAFTYYCEVAPPICRNAPNSRTSNCIRLCLQENDNCVYVPDVLFPNCQGDLHAICVASCGIQCLL